MRWVGKIGGALALVFLGISIVVLGSALILPLDSIPAEVYNNLAIGSVGAFGLSFTVWLASKIGLRVTSGSKSTETEEEQSEEVEQVEDEEMTSADYLHQFNRANKYVAAVFTALFVIGMSGASLASTVSGTPLAVLVGFLRFAVSMLGGTGIMFLNAAWFGAAWYGVKNYNASEAWAAGLIGWALFSLSGVLMLSASIGALAIVVAGLKILSYGVKARGETELKFLEEEVEGTVLEDYL